MALTNEPHPNPCEQALQAMFQSMLDMCRRTGGVTPSWHYLIGYCYPSADDDQVAELVAQVKELEHMAAEVRPTAEEIDNLLA